MLANSSAIYGTKILAGLVAQIAYFPAWWYSRGLLRFLKYLKNFLVERERSLALLVWIKNISIPMYGQYDWQGRLISFFMRLFQIIARGIVMLFWLVAAFAIFCLWIILPPLILYEIYFQII